MTTNPAAHLLLAPPSPARIGATRRVPRRPDSRETRDMPNTAHPEPPASTQPGPTAQPLPRVEALLDERAAASPDQPALIYAARTWTYAALRDESRRRAAVLHAAGFVADDMICLLYTSPSPRDS